MYNIQYYSIINAYLFLEYLYKKNINNLINYKIQPDIFPNTNDIRLSDQIVKKVPNNTGF